MPGWTTPALEAFEPLAAAGGQPGGFRSLVWSNGDNRAVAELRLLTNSVDDFLLAWPLGSTPGRVEIGGRAALLVQDGSRWSATWMVRRHHRSQRRLRGERGDALAFFESVSVVGEEELAQLVEPIPESMTRGCQTLWC